MAVFATRRQNDPHPTEGSYWKEILLMTPAPLDSLLRLQEVPRSLDWKFVDNYPPVSDENRRHYIFLNEDFHLPPKPEDTKIRDFCGEKYFENVGTFKSTLEKMLLENYRREKSTFQCTARLGKVAWLIKDKVLNERLPLQLERFTRFFERNHSTKEYKIKEDMYFRTITDSDQMCSKLGRLCDSNPELQTLLYFQFTNREDHHIIYRAVVKEELSVPWTVDGSSFQVKDFWPKPLVACKADFICFGRAHDVRVICRRATNEISLDVEDDIKSVVETCARNNDGNFEMVTSTDRMLLSHVYEKKILKFSSRDGWSINFIDTTDHIVKEHNSCRKIALLPDQAHSCQEIELMMEIDYPGPEKADEIKQMVLKMVDLSLDLVDMAEECLDPEKL